MTCKQRIENVLLQHVDFKHFYFKQIDFICVEYALERMFISNRSFEINNFLASEIYIFIKIT